MTKRTHWECSKIFDRNPVFVTRACSVEFINPKPKCNFAANSIHQHYVIREAATSIIIRNNRNKKVERTKKEGKKRRRIRVRERETEGRDRDKVTERRKKKKTWPDYLRVCNV